MGQKTNPIGNRLGFIRGWDSNWYGGKDYTEKLVEDDKIRTYLMARLRKASVANIIIERTLKLVTVTIKSARPGVIIGKGGSEVDKLREELKKLTGKDVHLQKTALMEEEHFPQFLNGITARNSFICGCSKVIDCDEKPLALVGQKEIINKAFFQSSNEKK